MDELTKDQQIAFDKFKVFISMAGGGFFLLQGPAGSGKSFMMNEMLNYVRSTSQQRAALAATTHKAAKVLSGFTNGAEVFTAHSLLGLREFIDYHGNLVFRPGPKYLEKTDRYHVIFCDEASMLDDAVFAGFEDLVVNKKIVFVGDSYQIPPVNHPNALPFDKETQADLGFTIARLTKIVRQVEGSPIIQAATEIRNHIYRPVLPFNYESNVSGLLAVRYEQNNPSNKLTDDVLDMFSSEHFRTNPDYCKVLAWRNRTVDNYNKQIRHRLFGEKIPKLMVGEKLIANAPFMEGQQQLVNNNEDMEILSLTVEDDQVGSDDFLTVYKAHVKIFGIKGQVREVVVPIIHETSERDYRKYLSLLKTVAAKEAKGTYAHKSKWMDYYKFKERYLDTKYSYCVTAHKSQGSTYDHCVVCLWDIMYNSKIEERNRIIYTAITRPKYTLKIIHNE